MAKSIEETDGHIRRIPERVPLSSRFRNDHSLFRHTDDSLFPNGQLSGKHVRNFVLARVAVRWRSEKSWAQRVLDQCICALGIIPPGEEPRPEAADLDCIIRDLNRNTGAQTVLAGAA